MKPETRRRPKGTSPRGKKRQYSKAYLRKRRIRNLILAGMLVFCVLVIFGIASLLTWNSVRKYDNGTITKGVYVSDVDADGMTEAGAQRALTKQLDQYKVAKVTMTFDAKSAETTLEELGFQMTDAAALSKKAMDYGKKGNIWKRYLDLRRLRKSKKVFQPTYTVDADKVDAYVEANCEEMQARATNASLNVTGDDIQITEEADGTIIDNKALVTKLKAALNSNWHGKDVTVKLTTKTDKPTVTKKDLKEVKDVLGEYSTDVGGTENRKKNVQNAASKVNGTLIEPGENISVNELTLPHTEENGFFEAASYENGEIVQSLAGGICQMCTTVYNAVLLAELDVTQRQPHSMIVSYVDPSRDAAIAGDYKDLKFTNNTKDPIYLSCTYENDVITAKIIGKETRPENRTIKYESVTTETKDPGDKKYVANSDEAIGSFYVSTGAHKGVEAELWKYVYIDGVEESKEQVNSSSYEATGATVSVGTKSKNADASDMVRSAISSQNGSTIQKAIEKAQALGSGSDEE